MEGATMSLSTTGNFIDADAIRSMMFVGAEMEYYQSAAAKQNHAINLAARDLTETVKLLPQLAMAGVYANSLMGAIDDEDAKAVMLENRETMVNLMRIVNNTVRSVTDMR